MKTSTFLIAPLLISFSSASLIGRNNGAIAEVQRPGYLTEGVQQAGGPIARKYIRRDRVRRQIPQLPKVPTEGVPGANPQLPGVIPTVPEVASSSVQAEEPATTVSMVAPTTAPVAVVPVVPSAAPVIPVVSSAAPVVPVVPIATPVVPVVSSAAPVVPVIPSAAPVKPVIPVVPVTPGMPGGPGGPGAAPIVIPPGSGDLPGRAPTGPVDEPLKVEGDLPPGFSVIGSVTAPSGVLEEPVKPSATPSAVVPSKVATVAPVPVSSGAAELPSAVPTSQPADGLPTSGAPELPAATTGLAKLPLPSAPANAPASSVQVAPPLSTVLTGLFTSSAPAALPIPSTPSQVVPVVPGAGNPVAGRPSFGNVQPVVSSAAAEPTLPALPNGFSVISSNIPAAAAATAGMHDFNRNTVGSQASATSSSSGAGVTPTGLAGLENGTGVAGNLPAGFKVIEAPAATTLVRRVRRRSIPQNDEELMYRYGSSK
ncbi:hypothetical protein EYR41_001807 [Orbilia oligospora]|uniref:Uncharacterized protein n=1 Tax=Orbilia oligospora TaxID=2813651 RepID=A0A7C8PJ98_ORBOL|nr:hypothetical protein TWF751_008083 [Orbilia oligospora]TGJ74849.1 hypothetical protein EYR41_001807 [Orbilia oligospora]